MEHPSAFCEICGDYLKTPTQIKYCSRQCAGKAKRAPMETCEHCGGWKPNPKTRYCSRECFWKQKGYETERSPRADEMIEKWASGNYTLQQIGQEYGVTRERVRQIIKKFAPTLSTERRATKREAKFAEKMEKERAKFAPRTCTLCKTQFYSATRKKYCGECAKEYNLIRMIADPFRHEKHRLYLAIMLLRDPERARNTTIQHGLRNAQEKYRHWQEYGYLPPPNRRYVYGAAAEKFLARIGPERWNEILAEFEQYYADTSRRITLSKDPGPLPGLYVNAEDYD